MEGSVDRMAIHDTSRSCNAQRSPKVPSPSKYQSDIARLSKEHLPNPWSKFTKPLLPHLQDELGFVKIIDRDPTDYSARFSMMFPIKQIFKNEGSGMPQK